MIHLRRDFADTLGTRGWSVHRMISERKMARLIALTALTMVAFAANSLLNRAALLDGETGPASFAALRLVTGAACLAFLVAMRSGLPRLAGPRRLTGTATLAIYMLGFSFSYVALDAGLGALILFGLVQLTMFGGAVLKGERPAPARWIGSGLAFAGLAWLVWPGAVGAPPLLPLALMVAAGIGWGIYSLSGRGATDPLKETAANFICAAPIAVLVWFLIPDGITTKGALLATVSGAITSGLGYALWYSVLPRLDAAVSALAQLTVPVIAIFGGIVLLSEPLGLRIVLASGVVLGGVAFGILGQRKIGSSKS
jgi:drug/metabolite transporter (DMT)-like permease